MFCRCVPDCPLYCVVEELNCLNTQKCSFLCSCLEKLNLRIRQLHFFTIKTLLTKRCLTHAFLDITQAFDKVWYTGLIYKLKLSLHLNYFLILKSYLQNRYYFIQIENEYAEFSNVNVGVPQGSVLGPILYLLFTAHLPI
jgi:hypothetical protein